MAPTLPRLYPATIERMRPVRWLDEHRRLPVRLVIAPPGWGKTTLLAAYARLTPRAIYYRLTPDQEAAPCCAGIAAAAQLEAAPQNAAALIEALQPLLPAVLLLDDAHVGSPQTRALVNALVSDSPPELDFVIAGRSRGAIEADRWLTEGIAVLFGPAGLAFDERETGQLALRLGVQASETGVARLVRSTEGWPIAVAGALRSASMLRLRIEGAYDTWRRDSGLAFHDFIGRELARAGEWAEHDLRRLAAEPGAESREPYATRLEREGLFVQRVGGVVRLQAVVAGALAPSEQPSAAPLGAELAPLQVRMFGPFDARVGAREIPWVRRRDQQIVQYLLLRPNGSATRSEVIETFWPDANSDAAAQSLRTACSNVRKALSAVVGAVNVERYFCSRGDVALRPQSLSVDVRQFRVQVTEGDREFEAGRAEQALIHYRSAEALYQGDLLADEVEGPWLTARRENLRQLYAHVLERSAEIWMERGEPALERRYAERLAELRTPHQLPARATALRAITRS
ncbi:hypothetical protein EPN44_15125 [bacterium]|nr:MAG: hypothetical protein EPN44_15125 [bacterium]